MVPASERSVMRTRSSHRPGVRLDVVRRGSHQRPVLDHLELLYALEMLERSQRLKAARIAEMLRRSSR